MGQGSKRWSAARAGEVLAEVKQSGESLSAYGRRHGIDPQRLYSWRRKLDAVKGVDVAARVAFVPVRIAPEATTRPAAMAFELVLGGGRVVRVGADFDSGALQRLVEALEEGSR